MKKEELIEILKENLVEGKLPCSKAFAIAKKEKITLKEIGESANEEKIRISNCQLGCFK